MSEYKDSPRAAAESYIRRIIRKAARRSEDWAKRNPNGYRLTQNQSAVLLKIANLAMHHHPEPMHPGKAALGKAAGLCPRTAQHCLRKFERDGFLIPLRHTKGGFGLDGGGKAVRLATEYAVDFERLMCLIEPLPNVRSGELVLLFSTYENGSPTAKQELPATCQANFACQTAKQSLPTALKPCTKHAKAERNRRLTPDSPNLRQIDGLTDAGINSAINEAVSDAVSDPCQAEVNPRLEDSAFDQLPSFDGEGAA